MRFSTAWNINNHYLHYFTETDLIPGMAAFIACLVLPLEIGILAGIGINVVFILYHAARPKITIEFLSVSNTYIVILEPHTPCKLYQFFFFPSFR